MTTAATTATAADTLRRQLDALNAHDAKKFASLYAEDAEVFDPAYAEPLRGRAAIEKDMNDFVAAFPELEMQVVRTIEQPNEIAYEIVFRGTHKGPLVGPTGQIPATNRRVEVRGGILARTDDRGRVVEERRYYNLAGLLEQIGLLQ